MRGARLLILYATTPYNRIQHPPMSITADRMARKTYTPQDIADATGRHPESIRRNLREGDLRGNKMGNEWIVTADALRDWIGNELFEIYFGTDTTENAD